jgi:hypothetical protein
LLAKAGRKFEPLGSNRLRLIGAMYFLSITPWITFLVIGI